MVLAQVVVNTPHNPTGVIYDKAHQQALAKLLEDYPDVVVFSDEAYEGQVGGFRAHRRPPGHFPRRYPIGPVRSICRCSPASSTCESGT